MMIKDKKLPENSTVDNLLANLCTGPAATAGTERRESPISIP
jgi:hypothetical protein